MVRTRVIHVAGSFLGALGLLGILLLVFSTPEVHLAASQASIVVNTLSDELNDDGDCSLMEAVQASNTDTPVDECAGGSVITDTITFATEGEILITEPFVIPPGAVLVIDGGDAITVRGNTQVRLFVIYAGADLSLRNLSLLDGYSGSLGGGIYNYGSLSIENSNVSNHHTGGRGGAIYNEGELQISRSTFSDNSADAVGGGIYNDGSIMVDSTRFLRNDAGDRGGGIYSVQVAEIRDSFFAGSHANEGAAIYTSGWTMDISGSTIYDNHAFEYGGGIYNLEAQVNITNTTISSNHADLAGGGFYHARYEGETPILTLTNSTVFSNSIGGAEGGSNISTDSIVNFRNSIIAGGVGGDNCTLSEYGSPQINDLGFNIEDGNSCALNPFYAGSMVNTNPLLGPLQDNGGPTWTHALLPGSPAIDHENTFFFPPVPSNYPPADQRGVARPVDGDGNGSAICDIGAYEFRLLTATRVSSDLPDPTFSGLPFTVTFIVTATTGIPAGDVLVSSGSAACSGELIEGSGSCQMTITAPGTYTLTATYSGDAQYEISRDTELHVILPHSLYLPMIHES